MGLGAGAVPGRLGRLGGAVAPGRLGGSVSNVVEPLGRLKRAELPPEPCVDNAVEPVEEGRGEEEQEESEEEEEEDEEDDEEDESEEEGEEVEDDVNDDRGTARGKSDDRRSSLVVGVYWDPTRVGNKWIARTRADGKKVFLGEAVQDDPIPYHTHVLSACH